MTMYRSVDGTMNGFQLMYVVEPLWDEPNAWVERAARVKREIGIPMAASWSLGIPENAYAAVRAGALDVVHRLAARRRGVPEYGLTVRPSMRRRPGGDPAATRRRPGGDPAAPGARPAVSTVPYRSAADKGAYPG
jgi:hypothetical protein